MNTCFFKSSLEKYVLVAPCFRRLELLETLQWISWVCCTSYKCLFMIQVLLLSGSSPLSVRQDLLLPWTR